MPTAPHVPPKTLPRKAPSLTTLVLLSALPLASLNTVMPSLGNLAANFGIGLGRASLVISLYMIVTAVLQVLVGPLSDLYGRRPVVLISLSIFALASLGCAFAPDFTSFMVFRILQAAVITTSVLSRAIVRDTSPPSEARQRLGTIGMAIALGPMLAPMVGGVLDEVFGWRATFHAFTLCGAGLLWWSFRDLGETAPGRGQGVAAHLRAYPALLRDATFWSYTACMGFSVSTFFIFLTGATALATQVYAMPEIALGMALGTPPIGFMLGTWIGLRFGKALPGASLILTGRLVTLAGMALALVALPLIGTGPAAFFVWAPLIGIGNALTFPAATVGQMSVRPDLTGSAAGLSGAVVIAFGAAAATLAGLVFAEGATAPKVIALMLATAGLSLLAAIPALRRDWRGIDRPHDIAPARP
jgi:DHA1 family bicyclomycin/chloramphenicol resistance-like MFS transporter